MKGNLKRKRSQQKGYLERKKSQKKGISKKGYLKRKISQKKENQKNENSSQRTFKTKMVMWGTPLS